MKRVVLAISVTSWLGCWGDAPPPATMPTPGAPAPVPAPAPAPAPLSCSGDKLDITALAAARMCISGHPGEELPAGVTRTIEPSPLVIRGGTHLTGAVALTNTTSATVQLHLADACDNLAEPLGSIIQNAAGDRVDEGRQECGTGQGCSGQTLDLELAPGGVARLRLEIDGRMTQSLSRDADCVTSRVGAVPPGTYTLVVDDAVGELHGKITVK